MSTDRLQALLQHFSVSAQVFHAGALCGVSDLTGDSEAGQLHLVRSGSVEVVHPGAGGLHITEPSLLLYPRPIPHYFVTDPEVGAEFACAHLHFTGGAAHPIAAALPAVVHLPLARMEGAEATLALLFEEAFEQRCGRQALLDRLFEVVLIQVLRELMDQGRAGVGMLAGLAHPQLRQAIVAVHDAPQTDWTLDSLAARAGMSRSVFAGQFRETVGCTPGVYLQRWRVGLAQRALRLGRPLKLIAQEVGYGSEAALSRAFKAQSGLSPRDWKQSRQASQGQPLRDA